MRKEQTFYGDNAQGLAAGLVEDMDRQGCRAMSFVFKCASGSVACVRVVWYAGA
jgi:hypothetical protein